MSYTAARALLYGQRLCHDLPGMHIEVAQTWMIAESGANNNPLGMTANGALLVYPTWEAGVDAAANRVKILGYYRGIVAALHGSIREQALAIIASPWNYPGSPYYTRIFTKAGLLNVTAGQSGTDSDNFYASLDPHQLHLLHIGARAAFQSSLSVHQLHLQHLMNS